MSKRLGTDWREPLRLTGLFTLAVLFWFLQTRILGNDPALSAMITLMCWMEWRR